VTFSEKVITPVKTGVQRISNYLKEMDSGFRRNDEKAKNTTYWEFTNLSSLSFGDWHFGIIC